MFKTHFLVGISSLTFIVLVLVHGVYFGFSPVQSEHGDWGLFGDFVGGVGGTVLTFFTMLILIRQNISREKEMVESRRKEDLQDNYSFFIQNLAEHRKIIGELSMHVRLQRTEMTLYGTEVLKYLYENRFADYLAHSIHTSLCFPHSELLRICIENDKMRHIMLGLYLPLYGQYRDELEQGELLVWAEVQKASPLVALAFDDVESLKQKQNFLDEVYALAALEMSLNDNLMLMRSAFMDFFHDWGDLLNRYFNNQHHLLEHISSSEFTFDKAKIVGLLRSFMSSYERVFLYYYYQSTYTNDSYNQLLKDFEFFEGLDLLPFCGRVFYRRFGYETMDADFFI